MAERMDRNVYILGLVSFFTDVSSEMVFPLIPLFLTSVLGAGKEIVGLIEGVADSIASLLDIFFGYWSDRSGRRKDFVIAGYGLSAVLKAGLVLSSIWQHVLFIRGAERIGKSIRTSPRDAIIAESTPESGRGRAFGLHRAMDTAGAIAGPAIAYLMLGALGTGEDAFRSVFLAGLIPAFIAVAIILLLVREPKKAYKAAERPGFWRSLRMLGPRYKSFLLISVFFSLSYFSFALLILRAGDIGISASDVILVYLLYNIVYAVVSVPVGMLSDRVGRKPVIAASFLLYAAICVGFIFAEGLAQVAALFVLYGVFVSADESVNKAFISDIEPKNRGTALGAYNSAVGAAYLPASAVFGILWAYAGAAAAFGVAAAIAAVAALLMAMRGGSSISS
ncbi:MAG: MFS transporter [Candidatus Micrarchaeia archaeon]